ncbi:MAG: damage-inducible protein DinB [Alphaproteobacteria bacterium]|nr:damage-inducible protein DinB [Alphaproteobacteria bacterium]MBF0250214.1 damage-inducible protein DinB [Alphaproteobacteria bacterium]
MSANVESYGDLQIMARYNRWANRRVYDCVAGLDDDAYRRDRGAFFGSIHATLNHLLVVDRLWTSRILGDYHGIKSLDQILHDEFDALRGARSAMDDHIVRVVDRLCVGLDGGLDKEILYRMISGGDKHASPARHILLTLFNHQTHHRGQVHCLLTQAGVENPPELDVIVMLGELNDGHPE